MSSFSIALILGAKGTNVLSGLSHPFSIHIWLHLFSHIIQNLKSTHIFTHFSHRIIINPNSTFNTFKPRTTQDNTTIYNNNIIQYTLQGVYRTLTHRQLTTWYLLRPPTWRDFNHSTWLPDIFYGHQPEGTLTTSLGYLIYWADFNPQFFRSFYGRQSEWTFTTQLTTWYTGRTLTPQFSPMSVTATTLSCYLTIFSDQQISIFY